MEPLIVTDTNSAQDSSGKAFGLCGNNYLFPVVSLTLSIFLFLLLQYLAEVSYMKAFLFSTPPFALATAYMWFLREGKPRGFDIDFIENLFIGARWSCNFHKQPIHPKLHD